MLKLAHITKSFNSSQVLRGVSFSIFDGDIVGIVGPSGSGKSVLLKIIGGVFTPESGEIRVNDISTDKLPSVGFLFQEGGLFDSMTVIENVAFPLLVQRQQKKIRKKEALERAYAILAKVGLTKAYLKLPGQLSGGMRRRVGIARALIGEPELLLLDDPTGGLDPVAAEVIMNLVLSMQKQFKLTVVVVSHDIRRLLPKVNRIIALFSGEVVCNVETNSLLKEAPENVIRFLSTRFDFHERI